MRIHALEVIEREASFSEGDTQEAMQVLCHFRNVQNVIAHFLLSEDVLHLLYLNPEVIELLLVKGIESCSLYLLRYDEIGLYVCVLPSFEVLHIRLAQELLV